MLKFNTRPENQHRKKLVIYHTVAGYTDFIVLKFSTISIIAINIIGIINGMNNALFLWYIKNIGDKMNNLTQEQQNIVACTDKSICVVAGAGTGKTHTMLACIEKAMQKQNGVGVLALTFSARANREARSRINKAVECNTIHSFCYNLIKEKLSCVVLTTDAPRNEIVNRLYTSSELKKHGFKTAVKMMQHISLKRNQNEITDQHVLKYRKYLADNGLMDYDEMALLAYDMVTLEDVKHINSLFIDEFQDTSASQYALLLKIAVLTGCDFFCVGDPRQAIYGWRGASPEVFDMFDLDFSPKVFELSTNFRSNREIVEYANSITIHKELKALTAVKEARGSFDANNANVIQIAAVIRDYILSVDYEPRKVAVLCRTNKECMALEKYFIGAYIPYAIDKALKLCQLKDIQTIMFFLDYLETENIFSLQRISLLYQGIGPKKSRLITSDNMPDDMRNFINILKGRDFSKKWVLHDTIAEIARKFNLNSRYHELAQVAGSCSTLEELQNKLMFSEKNAKDVYVVIMTCHKSKGLEFNLVVIPKYDMSQLDNIEENNIYYVAITRAMDKLILMQ